MPTYEYKGHRFSSEGELSPDDWKQTLAYFDSIGEAKTDTPKEKEKTAWYEDIDAGVRNIIPRITNAGLLGLGGIGGLVGAEDFRDAMFEGYTERSEALQNRDKTEGVDRGELGKVFQAVGEVPAYLSPITAAGMIGAGALNTGGDLVRAGADAPHALTGTMADATSSAIMLGLGPLLNLSGRTANAALQGGLNVVQEAGINHPIQNAIRSSAGVQSLPDMTSGDYAAAFVPGAAMGAAFVKPRGQAQNTPDTDPSLQETRLPSIADLDSSIVTQKKAVITSIEKQIQKLQLQQAELASNGPMSEKQFKFYQSLQEQIDFKEAEIRKEAGILSKYEKGDKAAQSHEELKQAIAELDISQPREVVRTPQQELVSPEARTQGSMFEFSPDGGRVYLKDRARAEALRDLLKGEKGSWTPFAGEEPRPDDSDAPGVRPTAPDHVFSEDGTSGGRFDELRSEIRTKWSRGKNEQVSDYESRIDKLTEAALAKERVQQSQQPDTFDLEKAGILRNFSKNEKKSLPPPKTVKAMEYELNKARGFLAAIERRMLGEKKASAGETVMGKQQEDTGNGRTIYTDKDGKKIVSFDSDQGKANLLVDKIGRLELALAKAKRTENGLAGVGNEEAIRNTTVKGKGLFASKDSTDPIDPKRVVGDSLSDLKSFGDLKSQKSILGSMFENLLGTRTSWQNSEAANLVRGGYSLKDVFSSIARTRGVEQGEDGQVPLLYYEKTGDTGYIGRFDIPKSLQKTGIGKAIWNAVKQELGVSKFYLLSKPESVGFWKKMGFKVDVKSQESAGQEDNVAMSIGMSNPFANKEAGMWTPFQTARDTNEKRARAISKSIDLDQNIDVTKLFSAEEILKRNGAEMQDSSGSTLSKIEREFSGRGQFVEANKRAQPVVWEMAKRLKAAKDNEIRNKRSWWSGDASKLAAKTFGPFMKLSHYDDPQTPAHVKLASTNKDRVAISEYMQMAQKEHVSHVLRDHPGLTEGQRRVLDAFNTLTPFQQSSVKVFTKMLEQIRKTRAIPYLAGFIPHVRKGDFAVYIKTSKGDPAHLETFTSKTTADAWIKMAKEKGYDVSDVVDFKTPEGQTLADSFGLVRDIMDSLNSNDPQRQVWINKIMDETLAKVSKNPDIGRHREHYTGLSGFLGTKLFKTRLENANDFFKSMEEYAQSSAAQHKKVEIIRAKNQFWDNPAGRQLREKFPNQAETADFLVDVAMNKDQKYGWTDSVDRIRTRVDEMYTKMHQKVRAKLGKDPELLYYPEVPILDRVTGAGAQLFYISALTTRPGFWIGQALTSPFAIRQFLKEGTIADTLVSQGKGWGTVMTGGDAEWKAFVKDMANQSDSVHPQFINEINTLPGLSKMGSLKLDKLVEIVTGQRPAGMADAVSRYTVAAMAYHHYKNLGMKGDQLASNVRRAVDDTMVMYDREHSPSVFNKMGLVGQNIAPLQKYGIAQLENLIGDLKFIAQRPEGMSTIRAMAPAISTLMTTMIMAGSIGLPLLMEYEMLRAAFVGVSKFFGWDDVEDHVPGSVLEMMLTDENILTNLVAAGYEGLGMEEETAKNAATHGVLSAATGYDIGSSLRFNPYAPGADQNGQVSALSAFPVIKFLADIGSIAGTKIRKHTAGDVTEAEDRNATLKVQPVIGGRAALDAMMFDAGDRDYVPGGTRGYAQVEQTPQEQIGMLIGAKPLETAKKNAALQVELKHDKKVAALKQKAVDLLVDGLLHDNDDKIEKAYSMAIRAEMTPKQLQEQVKAVMHERRTPRWEDRFQNRKGQVKSTQQKQRFERADRYE